MAGSVSDRRLGSWSELLASGLHQMLKLFACQLPGVCFQRHITLALAFAGILSRVTTAAAGSLAIIQASAFVFFHCGARTLTGTIMLALAFTFAGVQAFACIRCSDQECWIHAKNTGRPQAPRTA